MLRNEANVMYIAKLLGHASLKTTQKYLRVEIGDLKRVHSLYHPPRAYLSCRRRGDVPHTKHSAHATRRVPHHHQGVPAQRDDARGREGAPDR